MVLMVNLFLLLLVSISNACNVLVCSSGTSGLAACGEVNCRRNLQVKVMDICKDSKKTMEKIAPLDSKSSCETVNHVMETLAKRSFCSIMMDKTQLDQVENFAKFRGLFKGKYAAKCPEFKENLENFKLIGDALSSKIDDVFTPSTFKLHRENFGKLSDPDLIKYNLYVVKHPNHLSAYFEEKRSCSSERKHYVFQTISWGTENFFEKLTENPKDIVKHMPKVYFGGVPGVNKNVFNKGAPEEILRFQFPLGEMHKVLRHAPAKGQLWNMLENSCAGKIFDLVKRAFGESGIADLQHSSPFYEPAAVFGFLKKLANEAPNGHLLSEEERDAIVGDAFKYGVQNWRETFDEPIDETSDEILQALTEDEGN